MNLDEFRATARPVNDEEWPAIPEGISNPVSREAFIAYAEGYVLHEYAEKFWPHAWWYSPVGYDSKQHAEDVLFQWRAEFED